MRDKYTEKRGERDGRGGMDRKRWGRLERRQEFITFPALMSSGATLNGVCNERPNTEIVVNSTNFWVWSINLRKPQNNAQSLFATHVSLPTRECSGLLAPNAPLLGSLAASSLMLPYSLLLP